MKPDDPASDATLPASEPLGARTHPTVPEGYEIVTLLGRGGMGEVHAVNDRDIGREVAIKRMRGEPGGDAEARFLREAHIQARLDHPAIVPVHEIGRDSDGRPFFTMKRLKGTTLAEILAAESQTQQTMLRAFVDICLAIELAHSKSVVHRDLKPSNIMLGFFGEVYVLDWGVARMLGEEDFAPLPREATDSGETQAGSLLGTPGYMSPEQARGESVGPASDVYALGAILFEILVHEPLHPRGSAAISSTLQRPSVPPTERKPDVPPELCLATQNALDAAATTRPSARALADRVQRYLDGDRDLERRRTIAFEQILLARAALATNDRARAMQTSGRALALDPESREAAQILTTLTLEPPEKNPPELEAHLAATELTMSRKQWWPVAWSWLATWVPVPLILVAGVKDPLALASFYVVVSILTGSALYWTRRGTPRVLPAMLLGSLAIILSSRLFGPIILVPALLCVMGFGFISYPAIMRRPVQCMSIVAGTFIVILIFEAVGVMNTSWGVEGGLVVARSHLVDLGGVEGKILLVAANLVTILLSGWFAWALARSRYDANRALEIQAWHLRNLVPA